MNVNEIVAAIVSGNFNLEDRAKILNALNYAKDTAASATRSSLKIGQAVYFTGKNGVRVDGVVVKIMQKNIGVDCGANGKWRVGPNLLKVA